MSWIHPRSTRSRGFSPSVERPPRPGTHAASDSPLRRVMDVLVALVGLVVLGPVLAALMAAVRLTSPGPSLYRQTRVGKGETEFSILKLRSMKQGSDRQGALVTGAKDPRVTTVGRWLRATRLDELPQFVNLLRGDMTLIGPRPEVPRFLPYYSEREKEVFLVRPGVIGPGAILFAREQAQELDGAGDPEVAYVARHLHPKLQLDLEYLADRTLRHDLELLLQTALVVIRRG